MALKEYRYVGSHPQDFEVGDGKVLMVEPGGLVNIDLDSDEGKQFEWLKDLLLETGTSTPPKSAEDK